MSIYAEFVSSKQVLVLRITPRVVITFGSRQVNVAVFCYCFVLLFSSPTTYCLQEYHTTNIPTLVTLVYLLLFNCGLIYLFIVMLFPYRYMWLAHYLEDEVEVSLVVYDNFIAA